MSRRGKAFVVVLGVIVLLVAVLVFRASRHPYPAPELTTELERQGKQIFQDDTFGDEKFWTDTARLHEVVDQEIQPIEALRLGLKVDLDRLNLLQFVLHNPLATSGTRELLRQNAVVGIRATFDEDGRLARLGITCALCHSTVDNALLPGIGHRLDGWPNTSLELGKILAKLPAFTDSQKALLIQWPKGTYDPRFNFDGRSTPLVLPPAYGLADVTNETYTAEGPISYWNAYVAVTQMHGQGNFSDPRIGVSIAQEPDLVTPKLEALKAYQHALKAPPPSGFDEEAAARGRTVFDRVCAACHVDGNGTDNNRGVFHDPAETGMDATYAGRTAQRRYRTTPLRGLRHHPPYFHDGSAATLRDVVLHYDRVRRLGLSEAEQSDIEEYLKSL
ncbi:MAG TPA: c-type cytochrome [Gemmatimonadales bacterium]|nr:c-type cytochrome [Gemmatimonadales bacterium]